MNRRQHKVSLISMLTIAMLLFDSMATPAKQAKAEGRALSTDNITINGGGGALADGSDGIKMVFNKTGFGEQLSFIGTDFLYDGGDVGVHLSIGGTLYTTMRGSSASDEISNSAKFDDLVISGLTGTASSAGGLTTGDGGAIFTYSKTIGGKVYQLIRTVSYS